MKTKIIVLVGLFSSLGVFSQKQWTLKECVNYALKNNITIQQNKLNVALGKKDVAIAKGNFLPDFNASASNGVTLGLSTGGDNTRSSADRYNLSLQLSGGGTIFNGFINLNSKKQALLNVAGNEMDLTKIENDISLNVLNTYLNVLFAKENLSVAKTQAEISAKQIDRANAQFKAGAIPKGDLLTVKSTAANDNQAVIIQENTLNLALLNLSQLLQISPRNFDVEKIVLDTPSSTLMYSDSEEVYRRAISNMPEIKRAEIDVQNADLGIKISKGAFLPSLRYSLSASTFYNTVFGQPDVVSTGIDPSTGIILTQPYGFSKQLDEQLSYGLGLTLSIPIFNRFQTKNRVAKSVINKEVAKLALESQKLQLQQTIEQAFLDAKAAAKTFEAAKISLDAQKEAFKNAQVSYDYGTMTQFDFDQVRNRLVNAEGAMIRAKYDYVFKTKVLKFYYGEPVVD